MSGDNEGWFAVLLIAIVIQSYWTADKPYIDLIKASEDNESGETFVLTKLGSGQVAVFHGFMDDF